MLVQVTAPDEYTGDIIGDLNSRRGRIPGHEPLGDGRSVMEANVPLDEIQRYTLDLRSMTQGRASYTVAFEP